MHGTMNIKEIAVRDTDRCRIYSYSEVPAACNADTWLWPDYAFITNHSETDPVIVYNTVDIYDAFTGHPAPRIVITHYSLMAR